MFCLVFACLLVVLAKPALRRLWHLRRAVLCTCGAQVQPSLVIVLVLTLVGHCAIALLKYDHTRPLQVPSVGCGPWQWDCVHTNQTEQKVLDRIRNVHV